MATRSISFTTPGQQQSPLAQALGGGRSPQSMIALNALQQGTSSEPVGSLGEGFARFGNALLGGYLTGSEKNRREGENSRLAEGLMSSLPEAQRSGPLGQMLRVALSSEPEQRAALLSQIIPRMVPQQPQVPANYRMNTAGTGYEHIPGSEADPDVIRQRHRAGQNPWTAIGETVLPTSGLEQMFGGQPGAAPQPGSQVPGVLPTLRQGESGGNPNAVSQQGAQGLYQFTPTTWQDTLNRNPQLAQRIGPQDIQNPQAQEQMAQAFAQDIMRANGDLVGRQINGQSVTPENLVMGGWLGGIEGVRRYVETQGQYNPADANGTRISDYFAGTARNLQQPGQPTQLAQAGGMPVSPGAAPPARQQPSPLSGAAGPQPTMTSVGGMPAMVLPRSPQAQVNIDQRAGQAMVTLDADRIKTMQEQTAPARNMLNMLDRAERAIRSVPEGAGAQWLPAFGQAARRLGIDIQGTEEAEVLRSLQNSLAGLQRIPGSGSTSDYEMRLYMQAVPQLGNTREGNLRLLDMGRRLLRRRIEETQLARTVMRRDHSLDRFDDEVDRLGPVFTEQDMQALTGSPAPTGQITQPGPPAPAAGGVERWERGPDGQLRPVTR